MLRDIIPSLSLSLAPSCAAFVERGRRLSGTLAEFIGRIKSLTAAQNSVRLCCSHINDPKYMALYGPSYIRRRYGRFSDRHRCLARPMRKTANEKVSAVAFIRPLSSRFMARSSKSPRQTRTDPLLLPLAA